MRSVALGVFGVYKQGAGNLQLWVVGPGLQGSVRAHRPPPRPKKLDRHHAQSSGPLYRQWIPPRRAPERPSVTGKRLLSAAFSPVQIIRRHSANVLSEGDTFTKDSTRPTNSRWFAHRTSAEASAFA
jgi:hypothetical protein